MSKFERGQTVYTESGYEYEFFAEVDGVTLCRPSRLGWESGPDGPIEYEYFGEPEIVTAEVFSRPPAPKLHKAIAEQKAELEGLRKQESTLLGLVNDLEKRRFRLEEEAKDHEAFRLLHDFLGNDWTHYVKHEIPAVIRENDSCVRLQFLVSNERRPGFYTGSKSGFGPAREVTIHKSLEEARGAVQAAFEKDVDLIIKGERSGWHFRDWVKYHPWLEVPARWDEYKARKAKEEAAEKKASLKRQLAELEGEVANA